ncbi:M48 family metalloprotease [Herbidospora yilanensis]|uniref:M48 family metalloprotease n=1 Tax=Herbidospora yilanensis TaxID=354426 RepID=UPI000781B760|nr:M48 family metalloprotease [Herbidospora yilanensis]
MRRNGTRTAGMLGGSAVLIVVVAGLLGGVTGLVAGVPLAAVTVWVAYFFSDRFALAALRARPVGEVEHAALYEIVRELCTQARRPMPRLYVSPLAQPNAYATGRTPRKSAVIVTQGLLTLLDERELRGVIGHELAHVHNHDTLLASVAGALATMFTTSGYLGPVFGVRRADDETPAPLTRFVAALLAPIATGLVRLALPPDREFAADEASARMTGDPLALASALRRIDASNRARPLPRNGRIASASHMLFAGPFATRPTTAERVANLERLR